jgi:xylan 1,4-beta-xylosidase
MEQVDYLNKLGEYLNTGNISKPNNVNSTPCKTLEVNVLNSHKNLIDTFKAFTGVGRAKEMLLERVRDEIRMLQKEVGFRYVKFHGILDDSMMLYNEDASGNPFLTYNYVDEVMDFLLSVKLKPLIQLSFMPKVLSKDPSRTIFVNPVILSEPKDNNKWAYMITELTKHFISRYGIEEVRTWLFSFWNAPFQSYIFSFDTDEIAYELYRISWNCVKKCDSQLRFGTPSYGSLNFSSDEFYKFLEFCKENNCYPDFYNIHIYPVKTSTNREFAPSGEISLIYSQNDKIILSEDPEYMAHTLDTFRSHLINYPKLPIYITEWASTSSHRDWLNDTCYRSAYIVKNILENYDDVGSFGSWCLTDTMEELPQDN